MKTANKKIHEKKTEMVNEIADLIKNKKTMLIASVKNLPASQFQEISKKMRGKAIIKILKKNIINRALEEVKDEDLKGIKKHIEALEWDLIETTLREQKKLSLLPEIERFKKANIKIVKHLLTILIDS